jgi:hypothetical protein
MQYNVQSCPMPQMLASFCDTVAPSICAGERGGPQQHPWEVGAAFTTGFITYSQALLPPDADGGDTSAPPPAPTQPAAAAAAAAAGTASAGSPVAGSLLQSVGRSTMRRSTLLQAPSQIGPASQQQQQAEWAVVQQPVQQRGVDRLRLTRRFMPYPQPYPLGPALLEAQMWLLGKLLSVVNTPTLLQVRLLAATTVTAL